jgi:asparagine synthase (glutamine-hydrolysing)
MCGIGGIAGPLAAGERTRLLELIGDALVHRGPDDSGTFVDDTIGLVSRRLSILDVAGGRQPLVSEGGNVVCVCNGEIYNYLELRRCLEAKGHRFRTRSDSEVVVHLYEESGIELVDELRGMFALALWDQRRRSLLLARDPFGIKPLVYAARGQRLYFSSEAKGIVATQKVAAALDLEALGDLANLGFVVTPRTLFEGIKKLPPGHVLEWRDGEHRLRRYWEPSFATAGEYGRDGRGAGVRVLAEELRQRLTDSVRFHLQSDVPVAVMLSGGLDSSAILALAATHSNYRLTAFSLGFDQPSHDEFDGHVTLRGDARWESVHERCTREHVSLLPQAIWHAERPLGGVEVSRLVLARAVAAHGFKVVLTGEGSDELFGGYRWYHGQRVADSLAALPGWAREALACSADYVRPGFSRVLRAPAEMGMKRFGAMVGPAGAGALRDLLAPDVARELAVPELFPAPGQAVGSWDRFAQLQYYDQRVRLPDFVIDNLDSACMAASVEARVPFLDREIFAFARELPPRLKMRGLTEKYVLREAMRGILPEPVRTRKKHGMTTPIAEWLRHPLPERLESLISPPAIERHRLLRADRVRRLVREHRAHRAARADSASLIWRVLSLQLWLDLFVDGGARDRGAAVT